MSTSFVRVRLTRIDPHDINLFDFDYDLTMTIFFLDPTGAKVYARYGQRNGDNPDALQSLAGLEHTMQSVLTMHQSAAPQYAPRLRAEPRHIREVPGAKNRGCFHCHNVRETLDRDLKRKGEWSMEMAWLYPLPENVGLSMEVSRGNIVAKIKADSPAAKLGLQPGDQLQTAGKVPVHSIADLQFALRETPKQGELTLRWLRDGAAQQGTLTLAEGWRRVDIRWRPSQDRLVPTLSLNGDDLKAEERAQLGLSATQLAFRQRSFVGTRAKDAGFLAGDIILGVEGHKLENMGDSRFYYWLQSQYLIGEEVRFDIIREGKRRPLVVVMR